MKDFLDCMGVGGANLFHILFLSNERKQTKTGGMECPADCVGLHFCGIIRVPLIITRSSGVLKFLGGNLMLPHISLVQNGLPVEMPWNRI